MEQLTNEFRVGVPVERAYEVLTDVERIAPCLPGAQLQEIEGDEYRGIVKVKVGPITANYKGAATFVERQPPTKLVLRAEGRETRGQGNANATITVTLEADGDATNVRVITDLTVTGKVAQFGRGVLADVSAKLLGQFVECLETKVLDDGGSDAGEVAASPVEAATVPSAGGNGNAVSVADPEPVDGEAADPPAARAAAVKPAVKKVDMPEPEPVDLLATAGNPVAKRVAPIAAAVALLWLMGLFLRRRKRRRA